MVETPPAPPSKLSQARNALLACLGFGLCAFAMSTWTSETSSPLFDAKLSWLDEHRDEVTGLYIGSSNIYRSIEPVVVDRILTREGVPSTSFNLGLPGMQEYEADRWLRDFLAKRPARLEWVVIEARTWSGSLDAEDFTERLVDWHDWVATTTAVRASLAAPEPWSWRVGTAWEHVFLFACRATGAGLGPSAANRAENLAREIVVTEARLDAERGFFPLDEETRATCLDRREDLLEWPERYERRRDDLPTFIAELRGGERPGSDYHPFALEAQIARLEARGIEPVYVLGSVLYSAASLHRAVAERTHPPILAYNDPSEYPGLYVIENRYDASHLNAEGARRFSQIFGNDLAERLGAAGLGETGD